VVAGAFLATQFYSDHQLRTGIGFAIGLFAFVAAAFSAVVSGLIAAFVAIAMKQRDEEDVELENSEEEQRRFEVEGYE
jgi:hypothetical protein